MQKTNLNRDWTFGQGMLQPWTRLKAAEKIVHLPHDYMIESDVREDAPSQGASGFYNAGVAHYQRTLAVPRDWEGNRVYLYFDGAMMNTTVEINGAKAGLHHYGYSPFWVDISDLCTYGKENRISVTVNPSMQPNSRWYSGAGLFRGVTLLTGPAIHIQPDGIFAYTKKIEEDVAYLSLQAEIENHTLKTHLAEVSFTLDGIIRTVRAQLDPGQVTTVKTAMTVNHPKCWSAEEPKCSSLKVAVKDLGIYTTHFVPDDDGTTDEAETIFGIRTVDADPRHGLRINGRTVKLKGGCLHHDNGLLGAVSLPDAETRKVKKLKELGFNAIRTTHNPPSAALLEACDRLGMYVFDEAFDAWGMAKQPGDYNQFFAEDWQLDLEAFMRRDRCHPAVIIWSTGNEITERAGLGNGYSLARRLAEHAHRMDSSRPVSNGICSFWNGLDDQMMDDMLKKAEASMGQNADVLGERDLLWERVTEPFTSGLDIVGYNYLEGKYEQDHDLFPDRIILGSENFPKEVGLHWPMVEKLPYVIGEFTWTAWDYIGEAGIGRSVFLDKDDPLLKEGSLALQSHGVGFPWRTANDADFDILGNVRPQGVYRSIVFGSRRTGLFCYDPSVFDKVELISPWGFIGVEPCWTWRGREGKPVRIVVFSGAERVSLFLNGKEIASLKAGEQEMPDLPKSFCFETVYQPGRLEAVSYVNEQEISRDGLMTAGKPEKLRLTPETEELQADGESLCYVHVEVLDADGNPVPDAEVRLQAQAEGAVTLVGFGSGACVTSENYTSGSFTTCRGRAMAILRAGNREGSGKLTVFCEELGAVSHSIHVW